MVFAIIGTIILVIATTIGNVIMRNWLYFIYSLLICVLSCWALFLER
jgi:NADH:ubiquinone oxidoreductase subunit 6 (subunit J)